MPSHRVESSGAITRMPRALITGITGQDGSYLAELLLSKGYEVHGIKRRSSSFNTARIDRIFPRLHVHYGDLTDATSLIRILSEVQPDEIYNLAAQSHVAVSFEVPEYTAEVNALGTLRLLEAIRFLKLDTRFYQASTSEIFGDSPPPQNEETPFRPRSPYAIAKLHAHWTTINYRERGMYACCGILFNHESPVRGETFVTRKIIQGLTHIKQGRQRYLYLGNLEAQRDWGHARDYVEAMWLMLQQAQPDDYVIATGEQHSVRDFVDLAARIMEFPNVWAHIRIDERYKRPTEVDTLCGDFTKAAQDLNWYPKMTFEDVVREMINAER